MSRQSGQDVLCISRQANREVSKSLQEGQTVQFHVTKGPKGWQAENVRPLRERNALRKGDIRQDRLLWAPLLFLSVAE